LYSSRGILQEEAQLAEQRYFQQILVLRAFELRYATVEAKLSAASQKLDLIAKVAQVVASTDARGTGNNGTSQASTSSAPGKLSKPLVTMRHFQTSVNAFIDSVRSFVV
jgi:hypothetical protein